jgi:hypothetical protein
LYLSKPPTAPHEPFPLTLTLSLEGEREKIRNVLSLVGED